MRTPAVAVSSYVRQSRGMTSKDLLWMGISAHKHGDPEQVKEQTDRILSTI